MLDRVSAMLTMFRVWLEQQEGRDDGRGEDRKMVESPRDLQTDTHRSIGTDFPRRGGASAQGPVDLNGVNAVKESKGTGRGKRR